MDHHHQEGVDLEAAFFAKENARLLVELRAKAARAEKRDLLRKVVAIQDDAFLDRLIDLGIGPERALVLRLTPLVFVAWADGQVEPKERDAILHAAAQQGIAAEELAKEVLGDWLERQPDPRILEMWKQYIRKVAPEFSVEERARMKDNLLSATREVAKAAGGFLGIKAISAAEQRVLDDLESAFR